MPADFDIAVSLVLKHEGGYTPGLAGDPGGESNFGISKRAFPNLDIKNLTVDAAKQIYKDKYWRPWMLGQTDQRVANALLDAAVNMGMNAALQLHLTSKDDLQELQVQRLIRYTHVDKPEFYHAWFLRTLDV